jgi:hypothetical protein
MDDSEKIKEIIRILNEYPPHSFDEDRGGYFMRYCAKQRILKLLDVKDFREPVENQ